MCRGSWGRKHLDTTEPLNWTEQIVKSMPAMQETWVQFLGWEDPLAKGMATHSSILAWRKFHRQLKQLLLRELRS